MGLSQARFREALKQGKHEEVRTLFLKKTVQDSLEPNASLGPPYGENSVLHYAAQHAMAWLYGHLLDRGGKPDMRNGEAKNSLHLVCGSGERAKQRETILRTILELGLEGMDVKHVLRERDVEGDTALHLAAGSGLEGCVHLLLEHGADIFATNKREQTAADCAALNKHSSIATLLETKMVFSVSNVIQHRVASLQQICTLTSTVLSPYSRDIGKGKGGIPLLYLCLID